MIKRIRFGFRMLRYAYGLKSGLFGIGCFAAAALFLQLLPEGSQMTKSFFILLIAIWPAQLVYSLSVSDMVQASPRKKEIQTSVPALLLVSFELPLFLLAAVLGMGQGDGTNCKSGLLLGALGAFFILVYTGIAYKFFLLSTIGFMAGYAGLGVLQFLCMTDGTIRQFFAGLPYGAVVAAGILLVFAGVLAEYGVSLLVYRFPMSRAAQMKGLQKRM